MYGIPHYAYPNTYAGNIRSFSKFPHPLYSSPQTDVIVNTTGGNLCLSSGAVSEAILKKAGRKMQEEIDKYKKSKTFFPNVLETGPYALGCKRVYHTVCPFKSDDQNGEVTTEN